MPPTPRRRTIAALLALAAAPLGAQPVNNLSLGANSRGYVSVNGQFTDACTVGRFGQPHSPAAAFIAGSRALDCTGAGWSGRTVMQSSARTIRSYTRTTVTDPAGLLLDPTKQGFVSLSRAIFLDQMIVSSTGAVPDSARFRFYLNGSLANAPGPNTRTAPTANFSMGWDSQGAPGFPQMVVNAPGYYDFSFAVGATRLDRSIYFSTALQTFAILAAIDPTQPIFGEAITDYGHTLSLVQLQFVNASGTGGAGIDVTDQVSASFGSGVNYTVATPEPTVVGLLAAGLAVVGAFARRRYVAQA